MFLAAYLFAIPVAATAVALWYFTRNKRMLWKLPGRVAAAILLCASALPLLNFLFLRSMCGRYEFSPISSRDGKLVAQVNEADCGAIDDFHSSVYLWQRREGFFARVLGERAKLATVFTIGDDPRFIDVGWKDDRTLLIRYPNWGGKPDEFQCQSQWRGIQIECVGYTPDSDKPPGETPPVKRGFW